MLVGDRRQALKGPRPPGKGHTGRLVGQRDRDRCLKRSSERLDRVELERRQVVEAIEEHRPATPSCGLPPQDVERGHRALLTVQAPDLFQDPLIARE